MLVLQVDMKAKTLHPNRSIKDILQSTKPNLIQSTHKTVNSRDQFHQHRPIKSWDEEEICWQWKIWTLANFRISKGESPKCKRYFCNKLTSRPRIKRWRKREESKRKENFSNIWKDMECLREKVKKEGGVKKW